MDVMARAAQLVGAQRYDEALRDYLWALDHGVEVDPAFHGVRASVLVTAIVEMGVLYPPAIAALKERRQRLEDEVLRVASGRGGKLGAVELRLISKVNSALGDDERTTRMYDGVKQLLPPDADLRKTLWYLILERLIEAKRYSEAVAEDDVVSLDTERRLGVVAGIRAQNVNAAPQMARDEIQQYVEYNVDLGCGYFEALVGAGRVLPADTMAERMINLEATGRTFSQLIKHAVRAGSIDAARRLYQRALAVVPANERVLVDEAARAIPIREEPGRR